VGVVYKEFRREEASPRGPQAVQPAPPMLDVRGLGVTYASTRGPFKAVENFSLCIGQGEFVSVLGPSGCGKSTVLSIVAGLLKATTGDVRIAGTPVAGPRRDVGVVFQQANLLPWKSVIDNILLPITAMRLPVADYRLRAEQLLDFVKLSKFRDHYPHELSGGMQQRVGIARALIHNPKLLLMDEPFAALDAMTRERMAVELQHIWSGTDKTVLFITHSIPEAVMLSDRVVVMSPVPARVVEDVKVDLDRPRTVETMAQPRFAEACNYLRKLFDRLEVNA
jgi:NitT/TauT family transport system ATP-binding protein